MAEEGPQWRIDALDARGGLAFASWRSNHFPEADATGNPPCVFIGAPAFQPEMIANRSIAIVGTRGAFQYRLYIGQDEVPFPTLASVAEFVRRAYLRSGGGDGADGAGGERPSPLSPFDRPDFPRLPEFEERIASLVSEIAGTAAIFQKSSHSCPMGLIQTIDWPAPAGPDPVKSSRKLDGIFGLANAAVALIYEVIHRIPDGRDLTALVRWHADARKLGYIITAMGLWPAIQLEPYRSAIINLMRPMRGWKSQVAGLLPINGLTDDELVCFLCSIFFGDGPALDDHQGLARFLEWTKHWVHSIEKERMSPIFVGDFRRGTPADPIADLCRLPLPPILSGMVRRNAGSEISLYHALVSSVGLQYPCLESGYVNLCSLQRLGWWPIVTGHMSMYSSRPNRIFLFRLRK